MEKYKFEKELKEAVLIGKIGRYLHLTYLSKQGICVWCMTNQNSGNFVTQGRRIWNCLANLVMFLRLHTE